jgi:hypothetical protein
MLMSVFELDEMKEKWRDLLRSKVPLDASSDRVNVISRHGSRQHSLHNPKWE